MAHSHEATQSRNLCAQAGQLVLAGERAQTGCGAAEIPRHLLPRWERIHIPDHREQTQTAQIVTCGCKELGWCLPFGCLPVLSGKPVAAHRVRASEDTPLAELKQSEGARTLQEVEALHQRCCQESSATGQRLRDPSQFRQEEATCAG